jgi:hypothetical protein
MAKVRPGRDGGVNKSQAIRDYIARNPDAGPKQIKMDLAKSGIDVTATLISSVKYGKAAKERKLEASNGAAPARRGRKRRGRRMKRAVVARAAAARNVSFDALMEARKLAKSLGSLENAKAALAMLEQLQ